MARSKRTPRITPGATDGDPVNPNYDDGNHANGAANGEHVGQQAGEGDGGSAGAQAAEGEGKKKRGRKKKGETPNLSNVPDFLIVERANDALTKYDAWQAKLAEAKTLQGEYRASLKTSKNLGVEPDMITWWINARRRDVDEIDRETRMRNRMARLMALPIGGTLGLFDDDTTVAAAIDADKIKAGEEDHTAQQARDEGAEAFRAGESMANPYKAGTPHATWWNEGYGFAHDAANPPSREGAGATVN